MTTKRRRLPSEVIGLPADQKIDLDALWSFAEKHPEKLKKECKTKEELMEVLMRMDHAWGEKAGITSKPVEFLTDENWRLATEEIIPEFFKGDFEDQ